jgi:hypothetical protein
VRRGAIAAEVVQDPAGISGVLQLLPFQLVVGFVYYVAAEAGVWSLGVMSMTSGRLAHGGPVSSRQ